MKSDGNWLHGEVLLIGHGLRSGEQGKIPDLFSP